MKTKYTRVPLETKFRTKEGVWRTTALFLEESQDVSGDHEFVLYTLLEDDIEYKGRKLKSARKIYLECNDPTEYKAVKKLFGSWEQWLKMCESTPLKSHIESWREELEMKLKSEAIVRMITLSKDEKGSSPAKWLAECGWKGNKRGRPSKREIDGALTKAKNKQDSLNEYSKRVSRGNAGKEEKPTIDH